MHTSPTVPHLVVIALVIGARELDDLILLLTLRG
jgi:hypothetical protein